ncbi:MAG: sodium-translocating pyrophosphatase [Candidatus Hadarchaeales archaeon]
MNIEFLIPLAGLVAIVAAAISARLVLKEDQGPQRVREIAGAIQEGASAYLKRQYTSIWIFTIIVAALLFFIPAWGWQASLAFLAGAACSTVSGFVGMNVAVRANSRTANAATKGINTALKVAFRGGLVMGMTVVGVGVLGVILFYYVFGVPALIMPYGFGASFVALFARVGGGIYTKTADVGADLVGKVEAGIPEDDPRNPAVIADNVGDNVGDVAGMGADLFESYVASIIAAMIVGVTVQMTYGASAVMFPLWVAAAGIFASIIGVLFVRVKKGKDPSRALNNASIGTIVLTAIGSALMAFYMFGPERWVGLFVAVLSGLISGLVVGLTSDYFTNRMYSPARFVARSHQSGAAVGLLNGFSIGLASVVLPILAISISVVISYTVLGGGAAGLYGICLAGVGMLSVTGMIVSSDAYGPIADNAGGIVEQSKMPEKIRTVTDTLDSVGNTTKAICKGFAIGSAALTAIALFATYTSPNFANLGQLNLMDPSVLAGVFLGAATVALFCALTILAVGRNSFRMVEEVRRQFREIKGLMQGKARPDYARCVGIATSGALRELVIPSVLALIIPIGVGFLLGKAALGGFLAGSVGVGLVFALLMANAGAVWDNAKKYVELGNFGGKGSKTHAAAVIGDTVGDPFKDTAGPSINILIKLMSWVALICAPLLMF